jgi:hypothetical protein
MGRGVTLSTVLLSAVLALPADLHGHERLPVDGVPLPPVTATSIRFDS